MYGDTPSTRIGFRGFRLRPADSPGATGTADVCNRTMFGSKFARITDSDSEVSIMGAEENKKVVASLFEAINTGNGAALMNLLADSATWWVQGNFPLSGTKTKAQFGELLGSLGTKVDGGLRLTPLGITAEGDRVAVEAESYGKMKNGKVYQNTYHFLFTVRDGKIQQAKEYLDTIHANDVLCS
jgi:ketosteroid isomerase-like protein